MENSLWHYKPCLFLSPDISGPTPSLEWDPGGGAICMPTQTLLDTLGLKESTIVLRQFLFTGSQPCSSRCTDVNVKTLFLFVSA